MNKVYIKGINTIKGIHSNGDNLYRLGKDINDLLDNIPLRSVDRISKMALISIREALGRRIDDIDKKSKNNICLMFGTAYGAIDSIHQFDVTSIEKGALTVNPSLFPNTVQNSPACQVGIFFHFLGSILTICNGGVSGIDAVGTAFTYIKDEVSDFIIAGGVDEISELTPLMHKSGLPIGEAGSFVLLEKNGKDSGAPEIAGYYTIEYNRHGEEEFIKQTKLALDILMKNGNFRREDIHKIYFSYPDTGSRNVFPDILKQMNMTKPYYVLETDWMAAGGVMLIDESLQCRKEENAEQPLDIIITGGGNKVSALIIKYN